MLSLSFKLLKQAIRVGFRRVDEQLEGTSKGLRHPADVGKSLVNFVADGANATSAFFVLQGQQLLGRSVYFGTADKETANGSGDSDPNYIK